MCNKCFKVLQVATGSRKLESCWTRNYESTSNARAFRNASYIETQAQTLRYDEDVSPTFAVLDSHVEGIKLTIQAYTWRLSGTHALSREFSTPGGSNGSGHLCCKSTMQSPANVSNRVVTSITVLAPVPATYSGTNCCCNQAQAEAGFSAQSEQGESGSRVARRASTGVASHCKNYLNAHSS